MNEFYTGLTIGLAVGLILACAAWDAGRVVLKEEAVTLGVAEQVTSKINGRKSIFVWRVPPKEKGQQ